MTKLNEPREKSLYFYYGPFFAIHTHIGSKLDHALMGSRTAIINGGQLVNNLILQGCLREDDCTLDGKNSGIDYKVRVMSPSNLKTLGLYLSTYIKTAYQQVRKKKA